MKVIAIGLEDEKEGWEEMIKILPGFTHILDLQKWDSPRVSDYGIVAIPSYFLLDKEGRQQLRLASIQINEIRSIDPTHTSFDYQNSLDKIAQKMMVVSTPEGWKVDLEYSFPQKTK